MVVITTASAVLTVRRSTADGRVRYPFSNDPLCADLTIGFAENGSFPERALVSFPGMLFEK